MFTYVGDYFHKYQRAELWHWWVWSLQLMGEGREDWSGRGSIGIWKQVAVKVMGKQPCGSRQSPWCKWLVLPLTHMWYVELIVASCFWVMAVETPSGSASCPCKPKGGWEVDAVYVDNWPEWLLHQHGSSSLCLPGKAWLFQRRSHPGDSSMVWTCREWGLVLLLLQKEEPWPFCCFGSSFIKKQCNGLGVQ